MTVNVAVATGLASATVQLENCAFKSPVLSVGLLAATVGTASRFAARGAAVFVPGVATLFAAVFVTDATAVWATGFVSVVTFVPSFTVVSVLGFTPVLAVVFSFAVIPVFSAVSGVTVGFAAALLVAPALIFVSVLGSAFALAAFLLAVTPVFSVAPSGTAGFVLSALALTFVSLLELLLVSTFTGVTADCAVSPTVAF